MAAYALFALYWIVFADNCIEVEGRWTDMHVKDTTLAHGKSFEWLIDANGSLEIRRVFANEQVHVNTFSEEQLDQLNAFVIERGWTPLANNVQKLHEGTEQEGLGWFIWERLGTRDGTTAQTSSQVSSIFVKAGVWEDNGMQRGIAFRSRDANWRDSIQVYYDKLKQG